MMKRMIIEIALALTLAFTATAWSQESPMGREKMGMGESPHKKACMQMMGEKEAMNTALDELVGRMQVAEGAEKIAAMEEILVALTTRRREVDKRMSCSDGR